MKGASKQTNPGKLLREATAALEISGPIVTDCFPENEVQKLSHELEAYRREMEMQNEQLNRTKEEAKKIFDKYVELYDFAPIGYYTLSRDGVIISMNIAGAKILGIERNPLIRNNFISFFTHETASVFSNFLKKLFETGSRDSCEIQIADQNGSIVSFFISGALEGTGENCMITALDISEMKQVKNKLVESEELYRSLFRDNPQPMWIFDTETFRFLQVNEAAINKYGYSGKEFASMTILDIKPEDDIPEFLNLVRKVSGTTNNLGIFRHKKKEWRNHSCGTFFTRCIIRKQESKAHIN